MVHCGVHRPPLAVARRSAGTTPQYSVEPTPPAAAPLALPMRLICDRMPPIWWSNMQYPITENDPLRPLVTCQRASGSARSQAFQATHANYSYLPPMKVQNLNPDRPLHTQPRVFAFSLMCHEAKQFIPRLLVCRRGKLPHFSACCFSAASRFFIATACSTAIRFSCWSKVCAAARRAAPLPPPAAADSVASSSALEGRFLPETETSCTCCVHCTRRCVSSASDVLASQGKRVGYSTPDPVGT